MISYCSNNLSILPECPEQGTFFLRNGGVRPRPLPGLAHA